MVVSPPSCRTSPPRRWASGKATWSTRSCFWAIPEMTEGFSALAEAAEMGEAKLERLRPTVAEHAMALHLHQGKSRWN